MAETEFTDGMCLGVGCKYYPNSNSSLCYHAGFLPHCSYELREKRKRLDFASPDMYVILSDLLDIFNDPIAHVTYLEVDRVENALKKARGEL